MKVTNEKIHSKTVKKGLQFSSRCAIIYPRIKGTIGYIYALFSGSHHKMTFESCSMHNMLRSLQSVITRCRKMLIT